MIQITTDGTIIVGRALGKFKNELIKNYNKIASTAILECISNHFLSRFPGSSHYNPNKLEQNISEGSVNVPIPGVSRAYHDIDIYPVKEEYLCFPVNKSLTSWITDGGGWVKTKHVHQNQDRTILPTDEAMAASVAAGVAQWLMQLAIDENGK